MSFLNVNTSRPDPRVTVVNCPNNSQCGSFAENLGVDNRGYLNVAVSDVNRAVYIYLIGPDGRPKLSAIISCANIQACLSFGSSVAGIGDFNGDGWFPDLAIGANSVREVRMLWNGPQGFQNTNVLVSYGSYGGLTIKNSASSSSFGYPVVRLTDFNGDNIPDMAAGDRAENNLRIFKGKSLTKSIDVADRSQPVIWMTIMESYPSRLTFFSYATMDIPDMDGDSCSEIATSSVGRNSVYIIRGQKNAVEIRTASLNNPTYGANITDPQGVQFGISIALVRVTSDNCILLAVGDNGNGVGGALSQQVSMVSVCGFTSIDLSRRLVPRFTSTTSGNFGVEVAGLCDLEGDVYPDLGIGDPNVGTIDVAFLKPYMLDLPVNTAIYTGLNGGTRISGPAGFGASIVNLGVINGYCTLLSGGSGRFFTIRTEQPARTITHQLTATSARRGTQTRRPTLTRTTVSSTRAHTYTGEFLPTRSLDSTRTPTTTPTRTASQTGIRTRTERATMSNSRARTATPIRTHTNVLSRSVTRSITPTHLNTRTTFTPTHTSTRSPIPSKVPTTTSIATRTRSYQKTATSPTRVRSPSVTRRVTLTGRPTFTKVPTSSHSRVLTATHSFTRTTPSKKRTATIGKSLSRTLGHSVTPQVTRTDRALPTRTRPFTRTSFNTVTSTIESPTRSRSVTRPVTLTGRPTLSRVPTSGHSPALTATHPFTRTSTSSKERTTTIENSRSRTPDRSVTSQAPITRTPFNTRTSTIEGPTRSRSITRPVTLTGRSTFSMVPTASHSPALTATHPFTRKRTSSGKRTGTIGNSWSQTPARSVTSQVTRTDSALPTRTYPVTRTPSSKGTSTIEGSTHVPSSSVTRLVTHTGRSVIQRTHTKAPTFSHSRVLTGTHPFTRTSTSSKERTTARASSRTVTPLATRTDGESALSPIVSRGATSTHSGTHTPSLSSDPTSTHPFMRTTPFKERTATIRNSKTYTSSDAVTRSVTRTDREIAMSTHTHLDTTTPSHKRTATSPARVPSHTATRTMTGTINRRVTSSPTVSRGATLSSTDNNTQTHKQNNVLTATLTQSTRSILNLTTTRASRSSGAEKAHTSKTRLLSKSRTITLTATDRSVRKHSATVVPSHTPTPNQTNTHLFTATPTRKNNVTPTVVVPSILIVETRGAASGSNLKALYALIAAPVVLLVGGIIGWVLRQRVKRSYQGTHPRSPRDTTPPRIDGVPRPSGIRHFPSDLGGCATAIASTTRSTIGRSREQAMRLELAEHTVVEMLAVPSSPAGAAASPLSNSPVAAVISAALFCTPDGPEEAATTDDVMLATAPPQQPQPFLLQMPEGQPPTAPQDPTLLSLLSPAQSPTVNQPNPAAAQPLVDQSNPLDALSLALANVALPQNPAGTPGDPVLDEPAASLDTPAHSAQAAPIGPPMLDPLTIALAGVQLPSNIISTPGDPEAEGTEPTPPPHSSTTHVVQVEPAFPADSSAAAVAGVDTVTMATGPDPIVIEASPTHHHGGAFPHPAASAAQAAHSPPASHRSGVLRLNPHFRRNQAASPAPYTAPVAADGPGAFPLPNSPPPSNPLAPSPTHSIRLRSGVLSRVASPAPLPATALPAPVSQLTVETVQGPGGQELQSYSPRHRMPARTSVCPPPPAASTAPTHPVSQPPPISPASALPPAQPEPPMSPVTPPPSLTSPVAALHAGHQAASPRSLLGAAREALKVVIRDRAEETELTRLAREEAERNSPARAEPGMKGDGWVYPSDTCQDPQDPSGETGDPGGDALS